MSDFGLQASRLTHSSPRSTKITHNTLPWDAIHPYGGTWMMDAFQRLFVMGAVLLVGSIFSSADSGDCGLTAQKYTHP